MTFKLNAIAACTTIVLFEIASSQVFSAPITTNQLPSNTMPGVITNQQLQNRPSKKVVHPGPPTAPAQPPPSGLAGKEGAAIKFRLIKVIIEGNHVFSDATLAEIYKSKVGTEISVAELQNIVQSITNYYRNNGYILSRAILPPQRVANGVVNIKIIEGYVDKVVIAGHPEKAGKIVAAYGRRAIASRPLQLKQMEYYLRLANEVPGITTRAVLQPSPSEVGASDLQLVTDVRSIGGFLSYNNYGTRYVGPNQAAGQFAINSFFRSGDATRLMYSTIPGQPKLLKFYDLSYSFLLGTSGVGLVFGKNLSASAPSFTLTSAGIEGHGTTYYIQTNYPLIRDRDKNLTIDGAFNYLDSSVSSLGVLLYVDHLRTLRAGGSYSFIDRFMGSNQIDSHVVQGLTLFGATHNIHTTRTSRFGGRGDFTRMEFHSSRIQAIKGRFSFAFSAAGQYALNPVLSSEQFGFGGNQMGRGFDPSEIIGDRGVSGSLEFRMALAPGWALLNTAEPYVFYDEGVIWNLKNVTGIKQKQSAASIGTGVRLVFMSHVTGELFWGQPLTKSVAGLETLKRGRTPRLFFGVVFSA